MINSTSAALKQIPLIHIVDEDDQVLLNSSDNEWFQILYYFPCEEYCEPAAQYYDALYHYNIQEARKREEKNELPRSRAARYQKEFLGLLPIEWVIFGTYNPGNMQVRILRSKYS